MTVKGKSSIRKKIYGYSGYLVIFAIVYGSNYAPPVLQAHPSDQQVMIEPVQQVQTYTSDSFEPTIKLNKKRSLYVVNDQAINIDTNVEGWAVEFLLNGQKTNKKDKKDTGN